MKALLLAGAILIQVSPAWAGTTTCSDAHQKILYQTYQQEGGPCCGRSSSTLSYEGQLIKETETRGGSPGRPRLDSDSDPTLEIETTDPVDLRNSEVRGPSVVSHYATNLTMTRTTGGRVLPDHEGSKITISLVCESTRFRIPPP